MKNIYINASKISKVLGDISSLIYKLLNLSVAHTEIRRMGDMGDVTLKSRKEWPQQEMG